MKNDIIFGAIAIFFGSLLGYYLNISIIIPFLLLIIITYFYITRDNPFIFACLAFVLGMVLMVTNESSQIISSYERGEVIGIIDDKITEEEDYSSYQIKIVDFNGDSINENAIIGFYESTDFLPGDIIKARVEVSPIEDAGNPGVFNYKTYARINRIYCRLTSKTYEKIGRHNNPLVDGKTKFLTYVNNEMAKGLNESNKSFMVDVLTASNTIDREAKNTYASLGLAHILAVSGLHISIISSVFMVLFNRLSLHKYLSYFIVLFLLALYIYFIGFPASAIRAFVMFGLAALATILKLPYDGKKALAFSVFLMVLINPYRVFDMGLILSSVSIIGLLMQNKIFPRGARGKITSALQTSFVVNLFLFPFLINNFNSFNFVSFLANLIILPVFNIAVVLSVFKLLIGLISSSLASALGLLVNESINLIRYISYLLLDLDFLNISFESMGLMFFVLYYFLIALYIKRHEILGLSVLFKEKVYSSFIINLVVLVVFITILDPIKVNFIDVGQGDGILFESYKDDLMLDTGGSFFTDSSYEYTIKPYLEKNTSGPIPVIISHDDIDHSGNLDLMIEDSHVEKVYASSHHCLDYQKGLVEGDQLTFGNASLSVLYDGKNSPSSNDSSLILSFSHYGKSILFTGDAEKSSEEYLMDKDIKSDILKVGHHGSKSSTSPEFLAKVDPKIAIISVGRNNSYNHPSEEVLARLEAGNIKTYRTDQDGQITLVFTRFGYFVDCFLPRTIQVEEFLLGIIVLYLFTKFYLQAYILFYKNSRILVSC